MTDQTQLQVSVSARISTEFGQNRLQLIEAQVINEALQGALTDVQDQLATLQKKFDTISAENAVLHGQITPETALSAGSGTDTQGG